MTNEDILLVQQSWHKVLPIKEDAAALFYRRLFELDPELRHLFKGDMEQQGVKLMQMITAAVSSLGRLDALLPVVRQLGARHGTYGVRSEHYDTVAAALLWTLEQGLGDAFTAEVRIAWIKIYGVLAQTMRAAQIPPRAA